jgi:hypothetical protein
MNKLLAGAAIALLMTLNAHAAGSPFNDPSLENGGVCPGTAVYCEFQRDADAEWALEQQQLAKCNIEASRYNEEHGLASYGGWGRARSSVWPPPVALNTSPTTGSAASSSAC